MLPYRINPTLEVACGTAVCLRGTPGIYSFAVSLSRIGLLGGLGVAENSEFSHVAHAKLIRNRKHHNNKPWSLQRSACCHLTHQSTLSPMTKFELWIFQAQENCLGSLNNFYQGTHWNASTQCGFRWMDTENVREDLQASFFRISDCNRKFSCLLSNDG